MFANLFKRLIKNVCNMATHVPSEDLLSVNKIDNEKN